MQWKEWRKKEKGTRHKLRFAKLAPKRGYMVVKLTNLGYYSYNNNFKVMNKKIVCGFLSLLLVSCINDNKKYPVSENI